MGFANRGQYAEDKVREYLQWWEKSNTHNEANRLIDTKAAGRIVKAAKADFDYYTNAFGTTLHGLIEAKQTEHDYRLERSKVSQLPTLRKREKCGGISYVVVYHSTLKVWRAMSIPYLSNNGDKGSWDLRAIPTYPTCWESLGGQDPETFGRWVQ
jgi:penicillin-binding protein-related factor A (putative recombinase)